MARFMTISRGSVRGIKPKIDSIKSALDKLSIDDVHRNRINAINLLWRDAIQVFVKRYATRISIDTGMSASSLIGLAEAVNVKVLITGIQHETRPKHSNIKIPQFRNNMREKKSASFGEKLGKRKKAFNVTFLHEKNHILHFRFTQTVFQLWLDENGFIHTKGSGGEFQMKIAKIEMEKFIRNLYNTGKYEIEWKKSLMQLILNKKGVRKDKTIPEKDFDKIFKRGKEGG